jgi:hypothetical protein
MGHHPDVLPEDRTMVRGIVAWLLAVALLAPPSATSALVSQAQTDVSLARGWQRVLLGAPSGLVQGQGPTRVMAAGPGLVAFAAEYGATPGVALWDSVDGRTWRSLRSPALQSGEEPVWFYASGKILVVTAESPALGAPHIWASDDEGATWQESPAQLRITALAAGGDGVIAFCYDPPSSQSTSLWTSADGLSWRPVAQAAGVFASADVASVAQTSQGLAAGGSVGPRGQGQGAGIWTSPDGFTWTKVPNDAGIFGDGSDGSEVIQVVAGPRGILALGQRVVVTTQGGRAFEQIAWASPDGVHWRQAVTPFFDSNEYFGQVVAWQGGFVQFTDEGGETIVWSSPDGLTWTRVGSDELFDGTARVSSATGFQQGVAAVGTFALHPQPACLRTEDSEVGDLRTFKPAALLWSPTAAESAPPSTNDPSDPRTLRLRPADIYANSNDATASFGAGIGNGFSGYVNLCAADPALGLHRAYRQNFADPFALGPGTSFGDDALSIVTERASASRSAFKHAGRLLITLDATIRHKRELRADVRIGEQTRVFRLRLYTQAESSDYTYEKDAVAWRKGRVIGVVTASDRDEAVLLAKRQLAHLEHP